MKVGDRISIKRYIGNTVIEETEHVVEEFRFCMGIFLDGDHRKAGDFTPLCDLYEPGPGSQSDYISNYGEYSTEMVPAWRVLSD